MKIHSTFLILMIIFSILLFNIKIVKSIEIYEPIYIKEDGSIEPSNVPIKTEDKITYVLTNNIKVKENGIVINRDNIILDGNGYTLEGNNSGIGIILENRKNVTIRNIKIKNFDYGIYLKISSNNVITGNEISRNDCGICLNYSSNNIITGNEILENIYGIYFNYSSNGSIIAKNKILRNYIAGTFFKKTSNNTIIENEILENKGAGIYLDEYSSNNSIIKNEISRSGKVGIVFRNSSNNTITKNGILENYNGIHFYYNSSNNIIYYNNFTYNEIQVYLIDSINVWDNGSIGNYWSDYEGKDLNNDGIGDTPYIIDENNKDNYPLINPIIIKAVNIIFDIQPRMAWLTIDGITYNKMPISFLWESSSLHTIKVKKIIQIEKGIRYVFKEWNDGIKEEERKIIVSLPMNISAIYKIQYLISVDSQYGNIIGGNDWYDENSTITIKLKETISGFLIQNVFDHFEGTKEQDEIINNEIKIYVNGPREIKVIWRKDYSQLMLLIFISIVMITPYVIKKKKTITKEIAIKKEIKKYEEYLNKLEEEKNKGTISLEIYEKLKEKYLNEIKKLKEKQRK